MKHKRTLGALFGNKKFSIIFSLLAGVIFWLAIAMYVSPNVTVTIRGVPVSVGRADSAAGNNGLQVIEGQKQTIDIKVSGKQFVVGNLKASDFSGVVSLTDVLKPGTYKLDVTPQYNNPTAASFEIVDYSPKVLTFSFDYIKTSTFPIEADTSLLKTEENYLIDIPTLSADEVEITGPESDVGRISKVVARIEPDGTRPVLETTQYTVDLVPLDEENAVISTERLTMSVSTVEVTVPVLKTAVLPVEVSFVNQPSYFTLHPLAYTTSVSEMLVAGPTDVMDTLYSVNIGKVDFTALSPDTSTIDIKLALDKGIKSVENITDIKVTVDLSGYMTSSVEVTDIRVKNAAEGNTVTVQTSKLQSVTVVGHGALASQVTPDMFYGEIDLDGKVYQPGRYTVPVKVFTRTGDAVWAVGTYNAIVKVTS